jgi:hypothetical protein
MQWFLVIAIPCATVIVVTRTKRAIAKAVIDKTNPKDLPQSLRELGPVLRAVDSPMTRKADARSAPPTGLRDRSCGQTENDGTTEVGT